MTEQLKNDLKKLSNKTRAKASLWFFKTGKGQYGEGDKFIGVTVPNIRKVAKKYNLGLKEIQLLLNSEIHEHRLIAIFILVAKYEKIVKDKKLDKSVIESNKKVIVDFYLDNTKRINNWDLVDSSAHKILGDYLLNQPIEERKVLYELARSKILWDRRIAIISTLAFIKKDDYQDAINISKILLNDKEDLIHKAVGWVLREIGKKNINVEEDFLKKYYKMMPRTMLRYAIEKFSKEKKKYYMSK